MVVKHHVMVLNDRIWHSIVTIYMIMIQGYSILTSQYGILRLEDMKVREDEDAVPRACVLTLSHFPFY